MKLQLGVRGQPRRAVAAAGGSILLVVLMVGLTVVPAAAAVFSNTASIAIPATGTSGIANPYPSPISVSGLSGTITDVNVTLTGYSHSFPNDVDVLLAGPGNQTVVLMADTCGGSPGVLSRTFVFDQSATGVLPNTPALCTSGIWRPTIGIGGAFNGIGPAPAGPYGTTLNVFNGTSANGTWNLWVFDDAGGDVGSISGGWSLDVVTNGPTITSFAPTSGTPGTSVVITGTNFAAPATAAFGGVASTSVVVNSPTQITATVPTGAVTGPISVTVPTGTAASSTNFTVVVPPPTITSFTPTSGAAGTTVTIVGTDLTGPTNVSFGGVNATSFTPVSATQVNAVVPGAPTPASGGPITITTPGGTATSASSFTVNHARTMTLTVTNKKVKGTVSVTDGFAACASAVPVKVEVKEEGSWHALGTPTTSSTGGYSVGRQGTEGKYRATATAVTQGSNVCLQTKASGHS
jgi:subtilisin-like proprotein convertase family protein